MNRLARIFHQNGPRLYAKPGQLRHGCGFAGNPACPAGLAGLPGMGSVAGGLAALRWPPLAAGERAALAVAVSLLGLCAFYGLLALRALDDNRLTSWQWVFADAPLPALGGLLAAAMAAAWLLSGLRLPRGRAPVLLFLAAFAVAALLWQEPEVMVDGARYFAQAKYLEVYGAAAFLREWGHGLPAWTDLPLVPFIYGLAFKAFGESRVAVQCVAALFFSGTVLLTYCIGRRLWDDTVGLLGATLLLGMPYLLVQVPLMLVDVPTMFFLTLALLLAIGAAERGTLPWLLAAAAAIVLALLAKYSTWLMLSAVPLVFLAGPGPGWAARARRAALLGAGVALLGGAVLWWQGDVIGQQLRLLADYQLPGLGRWSESHVSTFLFQVNPLLSLAAACSLALAAARRDARYLIVCWMLLLVLLLGIRRSRYVLIAFPMLALMAAYAIRRIGDARMRAFLVLSIAAWSVVVALAGYLPFLRGTSAANLQRAGHYLDRWAAGPAEVILLPQRRVALNPEVSLPLLDLFTRARLIYRRDPGLAPVAALAAAATSPLRFSWQSAPAAYYRPGRGETGRLLAVVSDGGGEWLPPVLAKRLEGWDRVRRFDGGEGVFRYATVVDIYRPSRGQGIR